MKREYFKYDLEDVMEIVSETVAVKAGYGTFSTQTQVFDKDGEWYMLIVVGELEDMEIGHLDMDKLFDEVEYNGTHGLEGYWKTDEELKKAIEGYLRNCSAHQNIFERIINKIKSIIRR